jgi:four helix bundle protein
MEGYKDLKVWQLGVEISISIYRLTEAFPQRELYGLSSQMRRASISIPSNIAEGHTRAQTKDFVRFLAIARGSVSELETQLIIATRLGLVQQTDAQKIKDMLEEESRMLAGLRRSLTKKLRNTT